jgi:hypothetical protein
MILMLATSHKGARPADVMQEPASSRPSLRLVEYF